MGDRANSPVQATIATALCPGLGAGTIPRGIHLLWGHAGNLTHTTFACLQPACPAHALRAGHSACHHITQ